MPLAPLLYAALAWAIVSFALAFRSAMLCLDFFGVAGACGLVFA